MNFLLLRSKRKTELQGRYRCFRSFFSFFFFFFCGGGGGGKVEIDSYFKLGRVHIQPRWNEDHQFNLSENGFNLRPDCTCNIYTCKLQFPLQYPLTATVSRGRSRRGEGVVDRINFQCHQCGRRVPQAWALKGRRCFAPPPRKLSLLFPIKRHSGWFSGHQPCLPPLWPRFNSGLGSYVGWVSANLNLTPKIFLRVLRFSSLLKIDSQSITSGWVCGAPRSHMDRMVAAVRRPHMHSVRSRWADCEKPL